MNSLFFEGNNFSLTSSWKITVVDIQEPDGSYTDVSYSTPTSQTGTCIFETSKIPSGSKIISASFDYEYWRSNSYSGAISTSISTTGNSATANNLKAYLTNMGNTFSDLQINVRFQAASGQGSSNLSPGTYTRSVAAHVTSTSLTITYEYNGGTQDITITPIDGVSFNYHFNPTSLLEGESSIGTYTITGEGLYGLKIEYRPAGFTNYITGDTLTFTSEATSLIQTSAYSYPNYSELTTRATEMQVRFTFYTNANKTTSTLSDWINSGVYFLKSRMLPSITFTVVDSTGLLSKYSRPIQGYSNLTYTLNVTSDPYSDSEITSIIAQWKGESYPITNNSFTFTPEDDESITNTLKFIATDTYNLVGSTSTNITTYSYYAPKIETFRVSRYIMKNNAPYFGGEGTSGALTLKTSNASFGGKNPYTVTFSNGSTTSTLAQGTGNSNINLLNDLTKLSSYTFDENKVYNCSLVIKDELNEVTRFFTLRRAGAALLQIESTGVGIGCAPTGTASSPSFDCAFNTKITGLTTFRNVNGINSLVINNKEYIIQLASESSAAEGFITITI